MTKQEHIDQQRLDEINHSLSMLAQLSLMNNFSKPEAAAYIRCEKIVTFNNLLRFNGISNYLLSGKSKFRRKDIDQMINQKVTVKLVQIETQQKFKINKIATQ